MSENETFFLDTNILIKWIYRTILNENPAIENFINSLSKGQCVVLSINLSEFETIIYDAYNMTSHVIHDEISSKVDWDELGIEERIQKFENIRKNFEKIYGQIVKAHYNGQIPPGGIRLYLARRFFIGLEDKLIDLNLEAIKSHLSLSGKTDDLIDYIADIETAINQKCTILNSIKTLGSVSPEEIELIHEGFVKHVQKLKSKKYGKTPGRIDKTTFIYLFLLLRGKNYDKIVFITDDNDFKRMYESILEHLEDIMKGNADPRRSFREYAENIYNMLKKKLIIKSTNELTVKQ